MSGFRDIGRSTAIVVYGFQVVGNIVQRMSFTAILTAGIVGESGANFYSRFIREIGLGVITLALEVEDSL